MNLQSFGLGVPAGGLATTPCKAWPGAVTSGGEGQKPSRSGSNPPRTDQFSTESGRASYLCREKSSEHGARRATNEYGICWGERIRTSDWLIQNSARYFCHATWTSSARNYKENGAAGRSPR